MSTQESKQKWTAFVCGGLLGLGLALAGQSNSAVLLSSFEFSSNWLPSFWIMLFTAVATHSVAFKIMTKKNKPKFDTKMHVPLGKDIDTKLIVGSIVFAAGWMMSGFCPGPGLVAAGAGVQQGIVFVIAMSVGIAIHHFYKQWDDERRD